MTKNSLSHNREVKQGPFVVYSYLDWAVDVADRKSTGTYVFMMTGAAITWCSKKQTVVSVSSCEATCFCISPHAVNAPA